MLNVVFRATSAVFRAASAVFRAVSSVFRAVTGGHDSASSAEWPPEMALASHLGPDCGPAAED